MKIQFKNHVECVKKYAGLWRRWPTMVRHWLIEMLAGKDFIMVNIILNKTESVKERNKRHLFLKNYSCDGLVAKCVFLNLNNNDPEEFFNLNLEKHDYNPNDVVKINDMRVDRGATPVILGCKL